MTTAGEIFLYIAGGCMIVLTLMLALILYFVVRAAFEVREAVRRAKREIDRFTAMERRFRRTSRFAGSWFAHLPTRLFEAWGTRDY